LNKRKSRRSLNDQRQHEIDIFDSIYWFSICFCILYFFLYFVFCILYFLSYFFLYFSQLFGGYQVISNEIKQNKNNEQLWSE
jgi:hypothetical protein